MDGHKTSVGQAQLMGPDRTFQVHKGLGSPAKAQDFFAKLSSSKFRALHLRQGGLSPDGNLQWKRRARTRASDHSMVKVRVVAKRLACANG